MRVGGIDTTYEEEGENVGAGDETEGYGDPGVMGGGELVFAKGGGGLEGRVGDAVEVVEDCEE